MSKLDCKRKNAWLAKFGARDYEKWISGDASSTRHKSNLMEEKDTCL